jgi:hypothetical protein
MIIAYRYVEEDVRVIVLTVQDASATYPTAG